MGEDEGTVTLYPCRTPYCDGLPTAVGEPCPRCGRVVNDPTVDELDHELMYDLKRLREQVEEVSKRSGREYDG